MKKFINANKEVLVVKEDMNHRENFIDKLENKGIRVISSVDLDYWDAYEDILDAFNEIADNVEINYFGKPTQEELTQAYEGRVKCGLDEKFSEELATQLYYEDCLDDVFNNNEVFEFLDWLESYNKHFTHVSISDGKVFFDLIEYHPYSNAANELLDNEDKLEKELLNKWYTVEKEDGTNEKFSLDKEFKMIRYMLNKYNALED